MNAAAAVGELINAAFKLYGGKGDAGAVVLGRDKTLKTEIFIGKIEGEAKSVTSTLSPLTKSTKGVSIMAKNKPTKSHSSIKICSVPECSRGGKIVRQMCTKHYQRWRHYGDPSIVLNARSLESHIWDRVNKNGPIHPSNQSLGQCWEWTGCITPDGYGQVAWQARKWLVHRFVWCLTLRREPSTCLLHSCDNRKCVRTSHLFEGTRQDNMADKVAKGRQVRGDTCPLSKLTELEVLEARRLWLDGMTQTAIADRLGVHSVTIHHIVHRKTWRHI